MISMRVGYLTITIALAIASASLIVAGMNDQVLMYCGFGVAVLAFLFLMISIFIPKIYFDHYRYFISEDRVDIRKGVIFLRHVVVPIERIHQVEVISGPVNRLFGLADVKITTAGGVADINYLEKDEADRIAVELNRIVDAIVRGLRK